MTQQATERALRQRGDTFRRGTAAARKSLREAQKRVMGLNIARINEKVRAGLAEVARVLPPMEC